MTQKIDLERWSDNLTTLLAENDCQSYTPVLQYVETLLNYMFAEGFEVGTDWGRTLGPYAPGELNKQLANERIQKSIEKFNLTHPLDIEPGMKGE